MSGQIVLPDSSGVNFNNTGQRREWMEKAFRALGLWDHLKKRLIWERHEELVEEKLCERLDKKGWHNISHPHFEWAYDEGLWRTTLTRGNLTLAEAPWPLQGHPYPPADDLTLGVSLVYKAWRDRHGKSTEQLQRRGAEAQNFGAPSEENRGVSAVMANTPRPPAGQTATSESSVGHAVPTSAQAQSVSAANVASRVPSPKQEMDDEDHRMTGTVDPSIPSWPLPATHDNGMQQTQEPSDVDRGIDGVRSSGRWPESERGQGTPVLGAARSVEMTGTDAASSLDLAVPKPPLSSYAANAIERLERQVQELQEKVTSQESVIEEMRETLREYATVNEDMRQEHRQSEAGMARILGQMRMELNALRESSSRQ